MHRFALLIVFCSLPALAEDKPNFVVFFTDDQGYNDVGCYGSPKIKTPNFDQLAREGMRFTSFYAQNVCGPSRAALLTGCYPIRCGEPANRKNAHTVLHPEEITIAEVLHDAGYATACIGKWHVGGGGNIRRKDGRFVYGKRRRPGGSGPFLPELMPNAQGFDYYFGTPMHNGTRREVMPANVYVTQLRRNGEVVKSNADMNQLTSQYTEEAVRFIRNHQDQPFFLYLAHTMPHVALGVSDKFRGQSERGLYGDVIQELDASLGEILKTLKETGLDERTLVVFTSDNGPWVEKHLAGQGGNDRHYGSADPLRGWKMTTWEGGLRVPGIARWPGKVPAGKKTDAIACTMDFLPTFAKLAGAKLPDRTLDGKDLSPLLLGQTEQGPHDVFYYYGYTHLQAVRRGPWKLVLPRPANPPWTSWYGRMIEQIESPQLYNLDSDIAESNDVAAEHPEIVRQLTELAESARGELGDYNRIGRGARFFDPDPKRPAAKRWE